MLLIDEEKLVEQAKHDPAAFVQLYEKYYDLILNYALRRTGNVETALDITAETFFKALKNIRSFRWRNISFSAWLYKIASNEINGYFRKGFYRVVSLDDLREKGFQPVSPRELEEELLAAQEALQKQQAFLLCREKISQLPLKYQEVIALRFFAGKQLKEIVEITGKPEGTVKSLLHRGIEKLKKILLADPNSATFFQEQHYKG